MTNRSPGNSTRRLLLQANPAMLAFGALPMQGACARQASSTRPIRVLLLNLLKQN